MEQFQLPETLALYAPVIKNGAVALLIMVLGWFVAKWSCALTLKGFRKRKMDEAVARFLAALVQYGLLAAAVITALGTAGVETTSFVALLGTLGLAIGLALQGSLSHFASGVMLLVYRPFTVGDTVIVAGSMGVVQEVGLFATTLISPDNETIIVPNGAVSSGTVVNLTARGSRRGAVDVGVAYGAEIGHVVKVLKEAAKRADLVLLDPEPVVAFGGFGASALDFKVLVWSAAPDYLPMLHNVREQVYLALNEGGIDIPFQQIVVRQA
ncbi:MAG: mechanosensitive ion channel domain-containing protein [Nannocystaceae bacterium]